MKYIIIQGFDGKYSITDNGEVLQNWKLTNKGRFLISRILKKCITNKKHPVLMVTLFDVNGHKHYKSVSKLMSTYYMKHPPDNQHKYLVAYKDNNIENQSIENLFYAISTSGKSVKYVPKTNLFGTEKVCSSCGFIKHLDYFQANLRSGNKRNECNACRSKNNWSRIIDNAPKHEKYKLRVRKLVATEKYRTKRALLRQSLPEWYVRKLIKNQTGVRCNFKNILESKRLIIKIKRELNYGS